MLEVNLEAEDGVIFENSYLKCARVGHSFNVTFLGKTCEHSGYTDKLIIQELNKKVAAYELIPEGCEIIPANLIGLFDGLLIGGIMADSIRIVYGLGVNGISGYFCSVYFIPNREVIDSITGYDNVSATKDLFLK